jgi:hypothetical protein
LFTKVAADHASNSGIDDTRIESRIRESVQHAEWEATLFEYAFVLIFGMLALVTCIDAIIDREPIYSYFSPAISFGIALYVYFGRQHRLSEQANFGDSMIDFIGQGIASTDYQIARVKNFLWWFVVPSMLAAAVNMYYTFQGRPLWVWIIQPVGLLVAYVVMQVAMRNAYLPKKRELEGLRDRFLDPEAA